jgi:hypothetical protein
MTQLLVTENGWHCPVMLRAQCFAHSPGSGSVRGTSNRKQNLYNWWPTNTVKLPYYVHQFNSVTNQVNLFQWDILSANTEINRMGLSRIQLNTHTHTKWISQIILLSHLLLFNFTDDILLTTSCNTITVSKLKFGSTVASTIGIAASVFI